MEAVGVDSEILLKRLRNMVFHAPVATLAFSEDMRILEWNEAASQLFGVSPERAVGQPVGNFFSGTDGNSPTRWCDMARRQGTAESTVDGKADDGTGFRAYVLCVAVTDSLPEPEYILYVTRAGFAPQEIESLRKTDEARQRADLLNAIADGEINAGEVAIERGRSLGLDLANRYALFAISIDDYAGKSYAELQKDQRGMKELLRRVTDICSAEQDKIVWTRYDGFAVLCPLPENCPDPKSHAMTRAKLGKDRVVGQMPGVKLTVGVSSSYNNVLDIRRCYREAKEAANVGKRVWGGNYVYHYSDLGICQLLTQFQDSDQLQEFVERSLGKLMSQDATKGTQLVTTLEDILTAPNLKEAAERSFVHHKTMLARKNKIESILGVSLDDVETRLTLSTAMKILRLLPR